MSNLILERAAESVCPICTIPITTEFKIEEYNGKKIWLCRHHPVVEIKRKGNKIRRK